LEGTSRAKLQGRYEEKTNRGFEESSSSVIKLLCATSAFITCEGVPNYYLQSLLCSHLIWRITYICVLLVSINYG